MRILMLAAVLALSACGTTTESAVKDWKKTALANCEKEADAIRRQTCREQVATVTTTQSRQEAKKR
jgi:hypothetical protein